MPEFTDSANPEPEHYYCVFGSGDSLDRNNHITRARPEVLFTIPLNPFARTHIYFYGYHTDKLPPGVTEADTLLKYFLQLRRERFFNAEHPIVGLEVPEDRLHKVDGDEIATTEATCHAIVRDILSRPRAHVHLVMNWSCIGRAYTYMRQEAIAAGLNWDEARNRVHLTPCGGTYLPYVRQKGILRATLGWIRNPLLYELGTRTAYYLPALRRLKPYFRKVLGK